MTINSHIDTFAGLPVVNFRPTDPLPPDVGAVAWRVDTDYDGGADEFAQRLDGLLAADWVGQIRALVIGQWDDESDAPPPIDRLVAAAAQLTGLRALFLGEMTY